MSAYTLDYLRNHTVVGDVKENGMPWTARVLGVGLDDLTDAGEKWLYSGQVPLKRVRALLDDFTVQSTPFSFVRAAMPWDDESLTFSLPGEEGRFVLVSDESRQVISDVKRDTVHGVFKSGYAIHDFRETLLERTARIVRESTGDLHVNAAGVLADGAEAWVSVAAGKVESIKEAGITFYPHVMAASSHNGTLASSLQGVVTLPVCDNTRAAALGEGRANGTVTKARHSRKSGERLVREESEAAQALGLMTEASEVFAAQVAKDTKTKVTEKAVDAFLDSLFPVSEDQTKNQNTRNENNRDKFLHMYRKDERASAWEGTVFGVLQAHNTVNLWESGSWGTTDVTSRNVRRVITGEAGKREADARATLVQAMAAVSG